ncbi:MAG: hypothetical protein H6577_25930 [Lewinellaceae bacterium]|nr:hypothetical protein [Saprospiraceae bacterium]MCB9341578.1 hypothetical protein [Lewinellaceae bacterium]
MKTLPVHLPPFPEQAAIVTPKRAAAGFGGAMGAGGSAGAGSAAIGGESCKSREATCLFYPKAS